MVLVVDLNLREAKIWTFTDGANGSVSSMFVKNIDEIRDRASLKKYTHSITGNSRINSIAFRILFGGDHFNGPRAINAETLKQFGKLTDLFPFYIPSVLDMLKIFQEVYPNIPLTAFFETSFFSKLPEEEKYYALPFEYYKNSRVKKWGFHGIFHEANSKMFDSDEKTISVVLDKQTTVCAVFNKRPLSVSLGYTPLEGIMSRTSCGDMDPGIIFYLMNVHKFSSYRIDEMLKNESGFVGLTGYDIELKQMLKLRGKDAKVDLAFDVYIAQIMKYIGEGISVLGGLDNIVFAGENVEAFTPIIYDIIKKISFLGINTVSLPWSKDKEISSITSYDSRIKVYVNRLNIANVIFYENAKYIGTFSPR